VSTYLRDNEPDSASPAIELASDRWDLDEQVDTLLQWLKNNPDFDFGGKPWIVDVGFTRREGATVPGYTVSVDLMQMLSSRNITLWLTQY
jgi:hypothetical protein